MHAREQRTARVVAEIEHHVAQENDIETVRGATERQRRDAQVRLAEIAEPAHFGPYGPVFADVIEIADDEACRKAAVDFDAVVDAEPSPGYHLAAQVGALDSDVPAGESGKVLKQKDGQAVGFLTAGASGAPEAQAARHSARFDEPRQQFGAQKLERPDVAEEARLIDGHGLGDRVLDCRVFGCAQAAHKLIQTAHPVIPQNFGETRLKEVVARGIEHVLRVRKDKLAKKAVIGGGGCLHAYTAILVRVGISERRPRAAILRTSGEMASRASTL